jgi:hypothetical protein
MSVAMEVSTKEAAPSDDDKSTVSSDSQASSSQDAMASDVDDEIQIVAAPSTATKTTTKFSRTASAAADGDDTPMFDFRTPYEWISFVAGLAILILTGPTVGAVVFAAMIWEAVDRGFRGGFVDSGQELTGFLFRQFLPWLERVTRSWNERFVKRNEDAYMMNCIYFYGIVIPLLFMACAWMALLQQHKNTTNGNDNDVAAAATTPATAMTPLWVAFVYHLFRIGPYFMNFAYVYTLCHKEGHSYSGLFAKDYNKSVLMRNVFNWWVALFYGVLPASFAYGHSINHHRYNNGELDVVTTSDKPRDNFFNWVAYLPRWFLYASNISTMSQFVQEKNWKVSWKCFWGSLWWFVWLGMVGLVVSPTFALVYVAFPLVEAGLLLSAVNWSWHAFLNPDQPDDQYVQSITILDGCINVLNEDSHVVHHQYPGAHWTDHPLHQSKHWDEYVESRASCFRRTHAFEIFGMSVARDYDALAKKWVDLKGERDGCPMSHDERVVLMKQRLRGCWWGPRVARNLNNNDKASAGGYKTKVKAQ